VKANQSQKLGWPGQRCGAEAKGERGFARSFGHKTVLAVVAACLFAATAVAQTYTVLKPFNSSDGHSPAGGLLQATDGNLYGTTQSGGANGNGTIFRIDTSGSTFTTLHSFAGSPTEGAGPLAGLIQATDGNLYGTTFGGGPDNDGTIFKIDTNGSTFTTLHSFAAGNPDGYYPFGGLIQATDGYLYGTTSNGGANVQGTIFKIDTDGTTFTTLHSFAGSDGWSPEAGLIQGTDGYLYGTTYAGGANNNGTIFKINTSGSAFTMLHDFAGSDGSASSAGLIQATDGNLYGTTVSGGANNGGTIFRISTSGSAFATVHSLGGSGEGYGPFAGVVQATDGKLYGTTFDGGANSSGTIFKVDTTGSTFTTLHSFSGSGGTFPSADLIQATDGNIYGTTPHGGANDYGVVFGLVVPCFADVPPGDPFYPYICKIAQAGITSGCGGGNYCPNSPVTRAQMAVFLLKAGHTSSYTPPACTAPAIFGDVACPSLYADWIEQLSIEGITAGCGGGNYCPNSPVTRAQMAVFLLKAEHTSNYTPPTCTPPGIFGDVSCPGGFAVDWIERLVSEGITAGCGGGNYCPNSPNTRGQMAVFLVKTFGL
jgi:uncharacterized repeat protein (TIGR03803 family)